MAEHRDGNVAAIIPLPEICEIARKRVRNRQRVRDWIDRKQATIIFPDIQMVVALIDRLEQRLKILPQRLRQEGVTFALGPFKKLVRKQVRAFREGDKQNTVQDFLRDLDRLEHGKLRTRYFSGQKPNQLFPQLFVILIELARDILICAVRLSQQRFSAAT